MLTTLKPSFLLDQVIFMCEMIIFALHWHFNVQWVQARGYFEISSV